MSSFEELLNSPLRSSLFEESEDLGLDTNMEEPEDVTDDIEMPEEDNTQELHPMDDEPVTDLTPEEDSAVDDTMNAVATPMLLNAATEEEIREFTESNDCFIAESEGLLTERTIVRFDKHAKRAQLYEVAVAACAREHKDPLYKKLETVYKMERTLKAKLRRKYDAPAKRKVKEYLNRAKKSKSGVLARLAAKIHGGK